jgi:hypothetical protein
VYAYRVAISSITRITRRIVKRGGPGSGHFDHEGRPGKRGGSLPSGEAGDIGRHHSPALAAQLREVEIATRTMLVEVAAAFTPDGEKVVSKLGTSSQVDFTDKEIERMEGAILTHNHPGGLPFSENDLTFFAAHRLLEMRASVEDGVWYVRWKDGVPPINPDSYRNFVLSRNFSDVYKRNVNEMHRAIADGDYQYVSEVLANDVVVNRVIEELGRTWGRYGFEGGFEPYE